MDMLRLQNYSRVAFENDLPAVEASPACNHVTGAGCSNPPVPGSFYPIYTTIESDRLAGCVWQEGGGLIPQTINRFGGTSTTEYGPLLLLTYPLGAARASFFRFEDFRQVLDNNPCRVSQRLIEEIGGVEVNGNQASRPRISLGQTLTKRGSSDSELPHF
jgi:hypothetical protein